jgi:hypothetical protein
MLTFDSFSQRKIPKFNRLCGITNEKERKSVGTNSAPELTAVEFIGIQMHHNLNRVTIELGVIAQQAKRSSYKIFSKNWQSKPLTIEFHASLNLFTCGGIPMLLGHSQQFVCLNLSALNHLGESTESSLGKYSFLSSGKFYA